MPKLQKAVMKYVVSFNCRWKQESYGDDDLHTVDHEGDDVEELATEVIAGDPDFPMTFERNPATDSSTIGWFVSVDDDPENVYHVAVMVDRKAFCD